jgi:hypothetical protein
MQLVTMTINVMSDNNIDVCADIISGEDDGQEQYNDQIKNKNYDRIKSKTIVKTALDFQEINGC